MSGKCSYVYGVKHCKLSTVQATGTGRVMYGRSRVQRRPDERGDLKEKRTPVLCELHGESKKIQEGESK